MSEIEKYYNGEIHVDFDDDLNTYKKYVSNLDITKYVVLDNQSDYWYSAKYVDKMLKKQDKEIERLNNIINDIDRYIHNWNLEDIGEKTMLILNDILLIKNGMSDEVIRLKGSDKE